MNEEYIESAIICFNNSSTSNELRNEVENNVFNSIIVEPSYYHILFQISYKDNEIIANMALILLSKLIHNTYSSISQNDKINIKAELINVVFAINNYDKAFNGLEEIFENEKNENHNDTINVIIENIHNKTLRAMKLLSLVIKFMNNNEIRNYVEFIYSCIENALENEAFYDIGLEILTQALDILAELRNISPFIVKISNLLNDSFSKHYFESVWRIVGYLCQANLFPDELLYHTFEIILQNVQNEKLTADDKIKPLESISNYFIKFNADMINSLLDAIFLLSFQYYQESFQLPIDILNLIIMPMTKLPKVNIYQMIKEKVIYILSQQNKEHYVSAICALALILSNVPDIAFKDKDFLFSTFQNALDQNDEAQSTAVCFALEQFDGSFKSIQVYAAKFLPQIIPFLISKNNELRKYANDALHCLCDLIDTEIPRFFHILWEIKDQIPEDEISGFIPFIATSIEKTEDFGDDEIDMIIETIEPIFSNRNQYELASSFLKVISTLISQSVTLIDVLIPLVLPVLDTCLLDYKNVSNDDSLVNCLIFVGDLIETVPEMIQEFQPYIEKSQEIAFESKNDRIIIESLYTCCLASKFTSNAEMANLLQPLCCNVLNLDENSLLNDSIQCSLCISKLLNEENAKMLYEMLYKFCLTSKDCDAVADFIKPMTKLIKHATKTNINTFLPLAYELLERFINGSLPSLDFKPLSGQCDLTYMTNFAFFISHVLMYQHPNVNQLCSFIINILDVPNEASLSSYVGAFSDAIKYKTASIEMIKLFFSKLSGLVESADDPDVQHNFSYLFNIFVQTYPNMISLIEPYFHFVWKWLQYGQEQKRGFKLLTSNASSLFLTLYSNGYPINPTILLASIKEIPPYDKHETFQMIVNVINIVNNNSSQLSLEILQAITLSFSEILLMKDVELQARSVNNEIISNIVQIITTIIGTNSQIYQVLQNKYKKSKIKMSKLCNYLQNIH